MVVCQVKLYTADLHLGHELVAKLRGFVTTDGHDDAVLDTLRRTVNPKGDQLWILGDLSGGSRAGTERALELLAEIPGTKHLVPGNHCPVHPMHRDSWKWQRRYLEVFESVQPFARHRFVVDDQRREVLLSHFPYQDGGDHTEYERYGQYRLPHMGRWLLHGHTHSPLAHLRNSRQIHVGWDAWRRPVGEDDVRSIMERPR